MTGAISLYSCIAGYKAIWHKKYGYPDTDFLRKLDARLENLVETKLMGQVIPTGTKVGELTSEMAEMMGLRLIPGTAVAAGIIDATQALSARVS